MAVPGHKSPLSARSLDPTPAAGPGPSSSPRVTTPSIGQYQQPSPDAYMGGFTPTTPSYAQAYTPTYQYQPVAPHGFARVESHEVVHGVVPELYDAVVVENTRLRGQLAREVTAQEEDRVDEAVARAKMEYLERQERELEELKQAAREEAERLREELMALQPEVERVRAVEDETAKLELEIQKEAMTRDWLERQRGSVVEKNGDDDVMRRALENAHSTIAMLKQEIIESQTTPWAGIGKQFPVKLQNGVLAP